MLSFIAKRIMMMIPVLIIISIISFVIINLPPGDYLTMKIIELQNQGGGSARHAIEQLENVMGWIGRCMCSTLPGLPISSKGFRPVF